MNQTSSSAPRIALVCSSWHHNLVQRASNAFIDEVGCSGVPADQVDRFAVPGAFEIPLHASRLARTGKYDAIVACALVVDGGIYRHEFVASAVIDALMRVQLDCDLPVLSIVLTPHSFHDHETHRQFFAEHLKLKGTEAGQACLRAIASLREIEAGASSLRS